MKDREPARAAAPRRAAPSVSKRFYESVAVVPERQGDGARLAYAVRVDGRGLPTPGKAKLLLPTAPLAEAIRAEWAAQGTRIDPAAMPLTRLANSAIDAVLGREAAVRNDILEYAGNDALCYRADGPEELVRRQVETWDPVLAWADRALGAQLLLAKSVMPVRQPKAALCRVEAALDGLDAFHLVSLHVMASLMGSALLALAHAHGALTAAQAWAAAHVDEDWQIGQWGQDEEAEARRARRWADMQAASRLLSLINPM